MAYECAAWGMLGVFLFSVIYPWHPRWPGARWAVHLPLLLVPLWLIYEWLMPSHMNIRLDIPFIVLGMMVAGGLYMTRIAVFAYINRRSRKRVEV